MSMSTSKSVTLVEAVRDLVEDVNNTQRKNEIARILSCLKINPVEILQLSLDLDEKNIKKQYRKLSLWVHPDRCPSHLKENAQRAQNLLNNCKKDLETSAYVVKLKHQINEARRRVIERKMIEKGTEFVSEPPKKKQKKSTNIEDTNTDTDTEIKALLKEILIDCAWQKRIEDQTSQKLEQRTLLRREELKAQRAADKQYKKEWEDGRNSRVDSWRSFVNHNKKKKKKKRKHKLFDK